jgi:hypothetical protein
MKQDDDRPRTTPFALDYRQPQSADGMRALARTTILLIGIAAVFFTVAGFGMMITALFVPEFAGWSTGTIGATLLIAGGICITAYHYIDTLGRPV